MPQIRRLLLGRRLASDESHHTKLNNALGLSVFSSDALSSVAYATQEIMASLSTALGHGGVHAVAAGAAAHALFGLSVPVALGITFLLVILGAGYRQTILAYPKGGGAYLVAKDNLGEIPSLVAGASLLTDYILTVAVSVSAGVAAITAAAPFLKGYNVPLTIACIIFIAMMNLRGLKESGAFFAVPTYGFITCMAALLVTGFTKWAMGAPVSPQEAAALVSQTHGLAGLGLVWVFMRAFSAGCTALTGVEAISDGVPAFRDPASRNAAKTMVWMILILGTMFLSITFLANHFNITYQHSADPSVVAETLMSKLSKAIYGDVTQGISRFAYFSTQAFTFAILVVAANTAYADFPRLAAFMGRDNYLPKQVVNQGDRLVFSNGILFLTVMSSILVWALHANTDMLLPLYALGVFTGFTISQSAMVVRWWRLRHEEKGWKFKISINALGTSMAAIVWLDIAITKFTHGAWIVVLIIPVLVVFFLRIHRHYIRVRSLLAASRTEIIYPRRNRVVVLVSRIHRGTLEALRYAKAIGERGQVEALMIDFPDAHGQPSAERERLESDWHHYSEGIPLRVIESPYRKVVEPIVAEIDRMRDCEPEFTYTVVLPEFVTEDWWGNFLHNQTAFRLKTVLLSRPKVVVISIPFHLAGDF